MESLQIRDVLKIGDNQYGYYFAVGRIDNRWIGWAGAEQAIFLFPEIEENYELGLLDRDLVIKLTGAIAQSAEYGYGGIDQWYIPASLRGKPEDYTCQHCCSIGCRGACQNHDE